MDRLLGTKIGQYQVEALVGSGSVGTVYQAIDSQDGRSVCLKVVHPHLANDPNFRRRLTETTQNLGRLRHKFVVRFLQFVEQSGYLCIVYDWVSGETLGQSLQRMPMNLDTAVNIVSQAANILADAHRQGFVHGSLHPNNILLKSEAGEFPWRVILNDFSLSSLPEGEPVAASLPYLAPEIAEGRRADGRSDVYALGVILFQLATGRLPFSPASLASVVNNTLPSPRTWQPDIPDGLERLILKAAARKMTDRYRSMEEFALALRRDVGSLPQNAPRVEYAPPPPPISQPAPSPRPQPAPPPTTPSGSEMGAVVISRSGEQPRYFQLQKWLITVGQMQGNDLVLPGEGVEEKHARLEHSDIGWGVVDVGSRGGTYLDGDRLLIDVWEPWRPGQKVQIGSYTLEWRSDAVIAPQQEYTPPPPQVVGPVILPSKQGVVLSLKPTRVNVVPGNPAAQLVELENQGNRTAYVTLGVTGIPAEWVAMEANAIRLVPQQKATVPIAIQPPRNSSATAGLHSYQITVAPQDAGQETAVAQGQLTVAPFTQFLAEIQPSAMRHQKAGDVVLTNDGNMADRYVLTAEDQAREALFELPSGQLQLEPGQSTKFPIRATGRKRPFFVTNKVLPFELRVKSEEKTANTRGLIIVPPLISLLMLFIVVGIVALIVLLAGGYYVCRQNPDYFGGVCQTAVVEEAVPTIEPTVITATLPVIATTVVDVQATTEVIQEVVTSTVGVATAVPPPTTNPEVIGNSVDGNPIEAYRFGSGPTVIIVVGGIHYGYAPSSVQLADAAIAYFQADASTIPASVTLYIVRNLNPDSPLAPGDANGRLNAHGVNLNRNWDCNWSQRNDSGTAPLSEPESQALNNFVTAKNPVAVIMWNVPLNTDIQGLVSPGQCGANSSGSPTPSDELAALYAGAAEGYTPDQADPDITGDVTNYLAGQGFPAIFVLLDNVNQASLDVHLPALQAVMDQSAP